MRTFTRPALLIAALLSLGSSEVSASAARSSAKVPYVPIRITNPRAIAVQLATTPHLRAEYQARAAKGDLFAQESLGFMYLQGIGVPQDLPLAARYFKAPMQKHRPDALDGMVTLYTTPGSQQDFSRAYQTAAQYAQINANGQAIAGYFTAMGHGTRKDVRAGLALVAGAVNKGSATADYMTSVFYQFGKVRARDPQLADIYLQSAVVKGQPQALLAYGTVLITGDGGYRQDVPLGFQHLRNAARQGKSRALEIMAYFIANPPKGYRPDLKEGLRVARLCGDGLNANCNDLAAHLRIRLTRNQHDPEALRRLKLAATRGLPQSTRLYLMLTPRLHDATDAAILKEANRRHLVTPALARKLSATVPAASQARAEELRRAIQRYADALSRSEQS